MAPVMRRWAHSYAAAFSRSWVGGVSSESGVGIVAGIIFFLYTAHGAHVQGCVDRAQYWPCGHGWHSAWVSFNVSPKVPGAQAQSRNEELPEGLEVCDGQDFMVPNAQKKLLGHVLHSVLVVGEHDLDVNEPGGHMAQAAHVLGSRDFTYPSMTITNVATSKK